MCVCKSALKRMNEMRVRVCWNADNPTTPDSLYFHTMLLIIYLGAIERLICRREMSLIGFTSFGLAQNTMHDFQNSLSLTNATKLSTGGDYWLSKACLQPVILSFAFFMWKKKLF